MRHPADGERTRFGAAAALLLMALSACAVGTGDKEIVSAAERYRYVIPADWISFGYELRAPGGTVVEIEVHSLVDADEEFLEGLPGSIVPQLEERTRRYFSVVGEEMRRDVTLGGREALEVSYPIQVRDTDPESVRSHVIASHEDKLYVIQITYPSGAPDGDREGVRALLDSWAFLEAGGPVEIQTAE